MNEHSFMRVDDVAQELGVSRSYAYKLMSARRGRAARRS